jgi:hypothetical protein
MHSTHIRQTQFDNRRNSRQRTHLLALVLELNFKPNLKLSLDSGFLRSCCISVMCCSFRVRRGRGEFEFKPSCLGTLLQVTWLLIGFMFGRAFAKDLDRTIQATDAFKCQNKLTQTLVKNTLNFLHHFWMGLLLIVYAFQKSARASSERSFTRRFINKHFPWTQCTVFLLQICPKRFRRLF